MVDNSLGLVYIVEPEEDEGDVLTRNPREQSPQAPRILGTYKVTSRYTARGVPIMVARIMFSDGAVGQGKKRSDQPGFMDVFPAKKDEP